MADTPDQSNNVVAFPGGEPPCRSITDMVERFLADMIFHNPDGVILIGHKRTDYEGHTWIRQMGLSQIEMLGVLKAVSDNETARTGLQVSTGPGPDPEAA